MARNIYPCSQVQLYATAEIAWNMCLLHIGDFAQFNKTYTILFYEERIKEIKQTAEQKPLHQLKRELKELKTKLIDAKKDVLHNYKCMLEFIKMNRSKENIPLVNNSKLYNKASNNNWHACLAIASECVKYTANYHKQLVEGGNMPDSFTAHCKAEFEQFEALNLQYYFKKQSLKRDSFCKTNGGNTIYAHLTAMLRHAQLIYRKRPDMQLLFQFDKLLRKTKNAHTSKGSKVIAKPASVFSRVAAMF